jgi:hypothetical protein
MVFDIDVSRGATIYMIMDKNRSYNMDNKGSAIITGLVVSAILMVLCLSLVLVAYSLVISTAKNTSNPANRETLFSVAEAMEHEILDFKVDVNELSVVDGKLCSTDPNTNTELNNRQIWVYIYNELFKGFTFTEGSTTQVKFESANPVQSGAWLYYKADAGKNNDHSDLAKCSKYFQISSPGNSKIFVQFYWELPDNWSGDIDKKTGTVLNAIYKMYSNNGELLVRTDRKYILKYAKQNNIDSSTDGSLNGNQENHDYYNGGETYTIPSKNGIDIVFECTGANYSERDNSMGYWGNIIITNNSGKNIDNWGIYIYSDDDLSLRGNISPEKKSEGIYKISHDSSGKYFSPLNDGDSLPISVGANNVELVNLPKVVFYELQKSEIVSDIFSLTPAYGYNNENSYNYNIKINNNSKIPLEDWYIVFDFDRNITWNNTGGNMERTGNTYTIYHGNGGHTIPAYDFIQFTFGGDGDNTSAVPTNIKLYAVYDDGTNGSTESLIWKWNRLGFENIETVSTQTGGAG